MKSIDSRGIAKTIRMKRFYPVLVLLIAQSCGDPFANKYTTNIYHLNVNCVSKTAWADLKRLHSTDSVKGDFAVMLKEFEKMPFTNVVYYFKDNPEELIAVRDSESVGYVYNPLISDDILVGLSPELSKEEKERIGNRIQSFLRNYQCADEQTIRRAQEFDDD